MESSDTVGQQGCIPLSPEEDSFVETASNGEQGGNVRMVLTMGTVIYSARALVDVSLSKYFW